MKHFATVVGMTAAFLVVTAHFALSMQTARKTSKAPNVTITGSDCGKELRVKKGDVIEVRLPAALPFQWALDSPVTILRSQLKYPRAEPVPSKDRVQALDGRTQCVNIFEVVDDSDASASLKLMYCGQPTQQELRERIRPRNPSDVAFWTRRRVERKEILPSEYRPNLALTELKEGMAFQVTLRTRDEPTK